jgi:F420H(2)-dependent quinone reductase
VCDVDPTRLEALRRALSEDQTIDIVTRGARTGERRTTEIWFTKVGDEIFICGTPAGDGTPAPRRRRDWLANLTAHPELDFVLKESIQEVLPAVATVITDRDERTRVFSAPETSYYREQTGSLARLVDEAPLVRVTFTGEASALNSA